MKVEMKSLEDLGEAVKAFLAVHPQGGAFGLEGVLGAGKTAFVKACVQELSAQKGNAHPRTSSPTFVIHQRYAIEPPIEHFDLYRFDSVSENQLIEIGYWEAWQNACDKSGFLFVEWPERAGKGLKLDLILRFELKDSTRILEWRNSS